VKSGAKNRLYYATHITACWGGGVQKILETGDWLIEAKKNLKHGEFEAMVEADLPFGPPTARKLKAIAGDQRIRAHGNVLPPCWTTLYVLTKLSDKAFFAAMKSRAIHPGMQRNDAKLLVVQHKSKNGPVIGTPDGYEPPPEDCFCTSTTVWDVADMKTVSCDWDRVFRENGITGPRAGAARAKPTYGYSKTYSQIDGVIPQWALLRWAGPNCKRVLDPFAGEAITAVVAMMMDYDYTGIDIWQANIAYNRQICQKLQRHISYAPGPKYILGDGTKLDCVNGQFDFGFTCPPYWNLETYGGHKDCLAAAESYADFDAKMAGFAKALWPKMRAGSFFCMLVGNFRDRKGRDDELIDFRGDTVSNFRAAGFKLHQDIVIKKPDGSAATRAATTWRGHKLVPTHEYLLVFKKPGSKGAL
jgi:hypothetical protein